MSEFQAQHAAALLFQARRGGGGRKRLARLPAGTHPETMAQGVAAQVALAGLQGAAPPAGFKIGATAPRMQAYLGLPGPIAGFMAAAGLHGSGSTLALDAFLRPGVECELAVHLRHDLAPGPCTPERAADAVDGIMAAIELVENRYGVDPAEFGAPALVADQVFHAGAVLGEPYARWRELDLLALPGQLTLDGQVRDHGFGRDLAGGPMQALAWLAGSAEAAAFGGLRGGQVVMLGSVCPPLWLDGPGQVAVQFPPLAPVMVNLVRPPH